jgi:hypothetical protein
MIRRDGNSGLKLQVSRTECDTAQIGRQKLVELSSPNFHPLLHDSFLTALPYQALISQFLPPILK